MMINKIIVCPVCGKRTHLRIQDSAYLNEYPIRVNCINCRALLKGTYMMNVAEPRGRLIMSNAVIEECDADTSAGMGRQGEIKDIIVRNADYIAEISGELPCKKVNYHKGTVPVSPFLSVADNIDSLENRTERLKHFNSNMVEWGKARSIAFQLLDEGSLDYIANAVHNKMGQYAYECDHYLKSLHCLQEIVLEETKYLFVNPGQDECIYQIIQQLSQYDKDELHNICGRFGGKEELVRSYRKAIGVFSAFMDIYPNVLPAETFMHFKTKSNANSCISTCSFSDIKTFYQDAYESLLSLIYIPVCLDNNVLRGGIDNFHSDYSDAYHGRGIKNYKDYRKVDNGYKLMKLNTSEPYQKIADLPANKDLRNGIGHNNISFDGISQVITAFKLNSLSTSVQINLMDMAVDCIGLARSSVIFAEIILFMLREEFRREGVTTLIHPRYYKGTQPNSKCPCGSGRKYKKCCRNAYESLKIKA